MVREVIQQASDTQNILLDIGAGMGTDLRQIISHGWNRDDVLGVDITSDWDTLGYKLFRDSERPIPNFFGDILSPEVLNDSAPVEVSPGRIDLRSLKSLNPLKGRSKFLILNQVFHLFDEAHQNTLAERCAMLLSDEPGSAIFGMQMGGYTKGFESKVFVHSPEVSLLSHTIQVQVNPALTKLFDHFFTHVLSPLFQCFSLKVVEEDVGFDLWPQQGQGHCGAG
ncbi:hypothetical protein PGTUg99_012392 [Puccinia graminis f. sp. tritici]|uniref:Methyltransferase domain-containing protein n=1 Tax=Puccinia graminis f. sp. tritici TaxID=56615 RepID=A0A5B0RI36_PUCGR|nr:hypothetical protein PGTUg99_012392 [Puccinia graminis f. sp. tritici]